ncbi:hypothetical protein [Polaromonas sp.]|uniref:hypothetical protein n=1 Tax=Polaromonas sp. TaxID=1869339 RepID=UPI003BA95FBA
MFFSFCAKAHSGRWAKLSARNTAFLTSLTMALMAALPAAAQVCAPPSSLVTGPNSGIVNTYYQGGSNLSVGASSLTLGTRDTRGAATGLVVGDLLLVMQMQDATITTANNNTYGDGSGNGQGSTSVGRSGLHEFVRVTAVSGNNITFTPPLANSYAQAAATASTPQKRYQVIRVMQYSSLTANGITAPAWDGLAGGVAAVDVRDTLTLGNATVEGQSGRAFFLAGKGFRGGAGRRGTAATGTRFDYATAPTAYDVASLYNGVKGEGIAGTPHSIASYTGIWGYRTTNNPTAATLAVLALTPGYPGGSFARGAPGNAGGGGSDGSTGGNAENAGGGGGGNYGPGGIGGRPWNDPLYDTGGRGGAGYAGTLAFNRVFLGGGGGSGGTNDGTADNNVYTNQAMACTLGEGICSSGASGGGAVIIRARSITGSGIIDVRGAHGYAVLNDAAGGAGAGGSVIIQTSLGGNAAIEAAGGDGGNAWAGSAGGLGGRHGPGGAGGGGFVAFSPSSMSVSANVNGGVPGKTMSDLTPDEHYGSSGYNGGITTFLAPNVPGVVPAAQCDPNLSLTKTDGVSSLNSPGTTSYSLTVLNSGIGASSGTVAVADKLPAGLSVTPGPLSLGGVNAASWSCAAANSTDILCTSASSISGGGSSTFAITVAVSAANGSSLINKAQVSGGGDPNKTTPADPVASAASCTANNTPAGCALDTDTVLAPNLGLTKTNNLGSVTRGATFSYTLTASNQGGAATAGTITVMDVLPTGLSFSGTSPFTVNSFTCTASGAALSCTRTAALGAGASATITFPVLVAADAPSSVTNLARIGGGGDPSPNKQTAPTAASVAACTAPVAPDTNASDLNTGCAAETDEVRYVNLSLSKDDGAPFMSTGGSVVYTLIVRNDGTAPSSGSINIRDVLPSPMNFSTGTLTPGGDNGTDWSCTRVSATTATCTSTIPIPAGGASSFTLPVNVGAATSGDQLTNKARVNGGGDVSTGMVTTTLTNANVTDCLTDNNPAGCAIDMNTVQSAPKIRMTKSHPDPQSRNPGAAFAFTLTISNTGGSTAAVGSIQVIDVLPAGLTFNSYAATGFTCANTGQIVNCRNASSVTGTGGTAGTYQLAAGASRNITINVTVATTATNDLLNVAKVAASGDPQNSTPLTTSTANLDIVRQCVGTDAPNYGCATDLVPLNADLQISKLQRTGTNAFASTLTSAVPTGGTVQFAIDVTNSGPSRVTATVVSDTVPTNFTNVTWACAVTTQGSGTGTTACGTASGAGNEISLTTGLLKVGAVLRITVTGYATYATDMDGVTNTAVVTAPSGIVDGTPTNNISSVNTRVGSVNLSISKDNGTNTVVAGSTTTYTIVVKNTGDYPADGARLQDPLAAGLSCTAPPTCVASGAATSCPPSLTVSQLQNTTAPAGVLIPTLGPGGTLTLTYTCNVTATGL